MVFGLGTRLRVCVRTTLENGIQGDASLTTVAYLAAMATGGEGRESLVTNVGGMEGGVDAVPWNRFLPYNEMHVHQHVGYSIRVGLGHHFNICGNRGHSGNPNSTSAAQGFWPGPAVPVDFPSVRPTPSSDLYPACM